MEICMGLNPRYKALLLTVLVSGALFFTGGTAVQEHEYPRPTLALTFDDGSTADMPGYTLEEWNGMLLAGLKKHNVQAVLFWTGGNKSGPKAEYVLSSWGNAGHLIGNHTLTHPNFNSSKISLERMQNELVGNDSIIRNHTGYIPLFRFPYLKGGDTEEKRDGFRAFMKKLNYREGHVTIDASDWYVNNRMLDRLRSKPGSDITGFKKYYLDHLLEKARYYEELSYGMMGRHIPHILLLHHNFAAGLFIDDLITHFKQNGWDVIDAGKAFSDDIYKTETTTLPAGESLIWSMAAQHEKYKSYIRYPAEDSRYEKAKMDSLGL